jgi:uncharacterized damage-inducible protein DinB
MEYCGERGAQSKQSMQLSNVFDGWGGYQTSLVHAIEPLAGDQLEWRPSEALRSIGQIAKHISMGRINWFLRMKAPGSEELAAKIEPWDFDPHRNRYVREADMTIDRNAGALVEWLKTMWDMVDQTLKAWTVDDLPVSYRHVWRGDIYEDRGNGLCGGSWPTIFITVGKSLGFWQNAKSMRSSCVGWEATSSHR